MSAVATAPDRSPKLASVSGVEIFAAGTYRDKTYTTDDLDRMVENFEPLKAKVGLDPTLAVGHEEDQPLMANSGYPKAGDVSRIWREGDTLFADFVNVPPVVARLIDARIYSKCSAEVYDDYVDEATGQHYGKALRRVSLLGSELPQIKSLAEIPQAYFGATESCSADRRKALLHYQETRPGVAGGNRNSFSVFYEVRPMIPRPTRKQLKEKAAKFNDKAKATFQKFADASAVATMSPPPAGVDRAAMLDMLGQWGFDTGVFTDATPDAALAEIIRVYQGMMAADANEPGEPPQPQPGSTNADTPPIAPAPVPAPAPAPAPATSGIPGVTGQPTQVTLKFGEKDVKIEDVLKPLVEAAVKPLHDKLAAAQQSVDKFQEAQKKSQIDAKLDLLLKQGKIVPAELDASDPDNLRAQLNRADGLHKFSDGKTELDKQIGLLEKRPIILKLSEQVKGGGKSGATPEAEQQAVERFAESNAGAGAIKAAGKTPASYVATFVEAKKKSPELTAKQYGVPEQYLS